MPGATLLVEAARDRKGMLVGANSLGKHGTPKCEFHAKLLWNAEPENSDEAGGGVWIGARQAAGETMALELLRAGMVFGPEHGDVLEVKREVRNIAGCDMRADFVVTHQPMPEGPTQRTVVEVKTVVDTDYNAQTAPKRSNCVFIGPSNPYRRAGIFPWGSAKQSTPEGTKVVSARAIKHVRHLAELASGVRLEENGEKLGAALLFILNRGDAGSVRPNAEACPIFAQTVADARAKGVQVLAHKVRWGTCDAEIGQAFHCGPVPVEILPE